MDKKAFKRVGDKPLLTAQDLPIAANSVFNPGVTEVDGEVVLLLRIEDRQGLSQIRVARSRNGVDDWKVDKEPFLEPDTQGYPFEEWGCEDARVTQMGPREWLIAYTANSRYGPAVALAKTNDFVSAERFEGIALAPTNKDATVFPKKINGMWLMLHRPAAGGYEHIWFACSPHDLDHWGQPGVLLAERGGPWWDGNRVGVGAPPILTEQGWLLIYHGVKNMAGGPVYRLGLALLDAHDPRRAIARASDWIFAPEVSYEQRGLVSNVVYTCGTLLRGDEVWMYYGAADTVVGLAIAKLQDLLDFIEKFNYLHLVRRGKGTLS